MQHVRCHAYEQLNTFKRTTVSTYFTYRIQSTKQVLHYVELALRSPRLQLRSQPRNSPPRESKPPSPSSRLANPQQSNQSSLPSEQDYLGPHRHPPKREILAGIPLRYGNSRYTQHSCSDVRNRAECTSCFTWTGSRSSCATSQCQRHEKEVSGCGTSSNTLEDRIQGVGLRDADQTSHLDDPAVFEEMQKKIAKRESKQ